MGGDVDGCLLVSLKLGGGARRDVYKRDNIFIQCDSWTSHAPARSYWPSGSGYHILAQLLECHTRSGCANTQQQTRPDTETDPLKGGGGTRARTRSWVRMRTRHCQYVRRATKALPAAWAGLPRLRNDVHCNFTVATARCREETPPVMTSTNRILLSAVQSSWIQDTPCPCCELAGVAAFCSTLHPTLHSLVRSSHQCRRHPPLRSMYTGPVLRGASAALVGKWYRQNVLHCTEGQLLPVQYSVPRRPATYCTQTGCWQQR